MTILSSVSSKEQGMFYPYQRIGNTQGTNLSTQHEADAIDGLACGLRTGHQFIDAR
ncbi:MAG: hypothetical protein GY800_09455 [Planctomycetes bacterium]|nr:hypothetical protein [Planctomycetota bacterium]